MFITDCAHTIAAFIINLPNAFLTAFFSAFFYQKKEILNTLKAVKMMIFLCVFTALSKSLTGMICFVLVLQFVFDCI